MTLPLQYFTEGNRKNCGGFNFHLMLDSTALGKQWDKLLLLLLLLLPASHGLCGAHSLYCFTDIHSR